MKNARESAMNVAKLALGMGLIYYVFRSNMVDFEALADIVFRPTNLLISLAMLTVMTACIAARWYLLVRSQELAISFPRLVSLTMIGNFFNTFMPGSVGGDLIKAWYVAGQEPTRKTKAVFTVLLDRVVGLAVIIFSAAVTLLFYTDWFREYPQLRLLSYGVWAFTGGSLVFGAVFFLSGKIKLPLFDRVLAALRGVPFLNNIIEALLLYRRQLGVVNYTVILSAVNVTLLSLLWAIQGRAMGIDMQLSHYFFVVPIGLTVSAVPLLPGGIGVGQVAFFTLFSWIGMPNPEQGGTLCTLMQIYTILFNCIGAVFYLRFKRLPGMAKAEPEAADPTRAGRVRSA